VCIEETLYLFAERADAELMPWLGIHNPSTAVRRKNCSNPIVTPSKSGSAISSFTTFAR
jgi:hypothetical protein